MARDILSAADAIERAKDVNDGLEALICLMAGCNPPDVPNGKSLAELLSAVQQEMKRELDAADRFLSK